MYKDTLKLSVREALESCPSFLGNFFKEHWLLTMVYVTVAIAPAFVINDQDMSDLTFITRIQLAIFTLANLVPSLLIIYYVFRDSIVKIDPSVQLSNKSALISLWQIILMHILLVVIGVPLFIFFILPAAWWSVKSCLSFANLVSTSDGVIESIRKSHQLINERFWQCFGFLFTTSSVIFFAFALVGGTIAFFLIVGGILSGFSGQNGGISKFIMVFRVGDTIIFNLNNNNSILFASLAICLPQEK